MKFTSKIILLLASLCLVGCGGTNQSSNENSISASNISLSVTSENSSEIPASSSSVLPEITVNDKTRYESHVWDKNVEKIIEYAIKSDAKDLIPHYVVTDYVAYISLLQDTDMYGNDCVTTSARVLCYPVSKNCIDEYALALEAKGFVYSSEYDIFYAKATPTDMVYVGLTFNELDKYNTMNIQIYRKTIREKEWDPEVAYLVLGTTIPYIKCEAYEYYFSAYDLSLEIDFVNVTDKQVSDYKTTLASSGFYRKSTDAIYDVYKSLDDWLTITLYEGIDTFGETYLSMRLENAWPFYLIYASTYGNPVPKSSSGNYYGFDTYETQSGDYYTQIEYDNVEYNEFMAYCQELESKSVGYELYPDEQGNPYSYDSTVEGYGTIYVREYYKMSEEGTAFVDIMYSSGLQRLLIIIYA